MNAYNHVNFCYGRSEPNEYESMSFRKEYRLSQCYGRERCYAFHYLRKKSPRLHHSVVIFFLVLREQ